jgi:DNA repair protein RecN (Recombination protein N)
MLALRLTLPDGPASMVFDEVDAGIGGSTALVLADALAEVAAERQVLVVTHLAQVAARATRQITVLKESGERDVARAIVLDEEGRVAEIARMLSGQPDSEAARHHARELLGVDDVNAGQLPFV